MEEKNPFIDPDAIHNAGKKIKEKYIFSAAYSKGKSLLERLKGLSDQACAQGSYQYCEIIAQLMTCYHHEGGNQEALKLFKTIRNAIGNDLISAMDICNKYQEFYVNTLAFDQGVQFVEDVLKEYQPVQTSKNIGGMSIPGAAISNDAILVRGRTTSSLGSFYAYLGNKDMAEELFRDAIKQFESIGKTINVQITRSHLANLLMDTEDIHSPSLISVLNEYFSPGTSYEGLDPNSPKCWEKWLRDSFDQCTKDGKFYADAASFCFWIWIKAIAMLPKETLQAQKDFFRLLSKYPQHIEILKLRDHPAEMIRKYHALFMCRAGDKRAPAKDIEVLKEIIRLKNNYGTIPLLCRIAIYDIGQEQKTITKNETANLEKEISEDIKKLYQELHTGYDGQLAESLIDQLYHMENLKMSDLKKGLKYEFR